MKQIKTKTEEELLSKTIDWLRFPLIILVVFIHMNPVVNMQAIHYSSLSGSDIYCIISACVSHVFAGIAVPCFFVFSGFLFFYKLKEWNKNIYLKKIKSRVHTLIIPYLLWNLIAILAYATMKIIKLDGSVWLFFNDLMDKGVLKVFWNYYEWGSSNTNILGQIIPYYGPFDIPLWFLRDLIVSVTLSPLIYYFVKKTKLYGIVLLGILYYTRIWFITPGFSITAFFFFSMGAYFSIHGKNMIIELRKYRICWLLVALITIIISTYFDGSKTNDYIFPVYVLSGVITIINAASFLLEREYIRVVDTLSKASFFIYAIHTILILDFTRVLFDHILKPQGSVILIIKYFTVPVISIFVSLCLYCLMKKIIPNILRILTGNR